MKAPEGRFPLLKPSVYYWLNGPCHQLQGVGLFVVEELEYTRPRNVGHGDIGSVVRGDILGHAVGFEEHGKRACRACGYCLRQLDQDQPPVPGIGKGVVLE